MTPLEDRRWREHLTAQITDAVEMLDTGRTYAVRAILARLLGHLGAEVPTPITPPAPPAATRRSGPPIAPDGGAA